jgi:hypothetical protein
MSGNPSHFGGPTGLSTKHILQQAFSPHMHKIPDYRRSRVQVGVTIAPRVRLLADLVFLDIYHGYEASSSFRPIATYLQGVALCQGIMNCVCKINEPCPSRSLHGETLGHLNMSLWNRTPQEKVEGSGFGLAIGRMKRSNVEL